MTIRIFLRTVLELLLINFVVIILVVLQKDVQFLEMIAIQIVDLLPALIQETQIVATRIVGCVWGVVMMIASIVKVQQLGTSMNHPMGDAVIAPAPHALLLEQTIV